MRNSPLNSIFKTEEDLIDCVMTSCHVPWIINGTAMTKYANKRYMDGIQRKIQNAKTDA